MSDSVERYVEAFASAEPTLPGRELSWLANARQQALERFRAIGFPKPREEDWKYTRVAPIERRAFAAPSPGASADPAPFLLPPEVGAHQIVFVDGHFREELSRPAALADGAQVMSLAAALAAEGGALAPYLAGGEEHPNGFSALNAAFAADGVVLRLADGVRLEAPVHLLFLASGSADTIAHPRIIVDAGRGARAVVLEHYACAAGAAYFHNVVTQVSLAEQARVEHYKLQRESSSAFHVARMDVHQQAGSRFVSHSVSLGAALSRHDIDVTLDAPHASCALNGLYFGRGRQHVDYHTRVEHAKPDCASSEDYRGILAGRARGVFNGRVHVHPHAQRTDASQSNRNLLLSRDAEVDTKPQLEIFADDVKCSHGATVGQLDERMIFYLRSRGLDETAARGLLTYGFARDLVDRMDIEAVREAVAEALLERLPQADEVRSMLS